MSNALTIMRRDLSAYFTSPIGYIFMIVFVTISVGLYITSFFTFPVADMRPFFGNIPLLLCVFIPAVTMRVWAEERKENTWEMLLTFPMKAWELVIGKFMASVVFFALTLAATFTVPMMLFSLGNPDNGAVIAGYFGTLLLGAYFLAIGVFFSGFFKDQIVAFVVTLLVCFTIFLVGTNFAAAYIDGMRPGLGSLLSELVGLSDHFAAFTRGVIELADILYFLAWTILFLVLNVLYIDGRNRPGARTYFGTAVGMCAVIGLLGNWLISDTSLARFDVTEDKIYTVSDASARILSDLDTPVTVNYYVTPNEEMPTGMKDLEQDIVDKIDELRLASGGKVRVNPIYLKVSNVLEAQESAFSQPEEGEEEEETEEEVLETRMLEKGIRPFSVQAMSNDEITNKLIYSSIGIAYKDKSEEILPQVMPQMLDDLEYMLVSTIYKLAQEELPTIALVAPKEAVNIPPEVRRMYEQMGQPVPQSEDPYDVLEQVLQQEKYNVTRVDLTQDSPMPEEYDTLVVVNPRAFNERQRWEINRALHSGKSVVLAVQNYEWDYRATQRSMSLNKREENPGVNELLESYGVTVDKDILMDVNHVPLTVQSQGGGILSQLMGQQVNLPTHMLINNSSMNPDTSITSRLSAVFYLWGTALEYDQDTIDKHGLNVTTLMSTTDEAWTVPADAPIAQEDFENPSGSEQYPLMAMVEGQFPDAYEGQERPAWPVPQPQPGQPPPPPAPEEEPAGEITPAPGRLILVGCSEMFRKNFLQGGSGNIDLFMNSVDALSLSDDLVNVRGRKPVDRIIDMPSEAVRLRWKMFNYLFSAVVIAAVGVGVTMARRRSRNAYTMAHASEG